MAPRLLFTFFAMLFGLVSCAAQTVLDLRRDEAALQLENGDIAFILAASPDRMGELARIHASAPYYAGLLAKNSGAGEGEERAAALFEAALDGQDRARLEAAGELLALVRVRNEAETRRLLSRLESMGSAAKSALRTLRAACLYGLDRRADLEALYGDAGSPDMGPMDRAFLLLAASREAADPGTENGLAEKLADFFLADDLADAAETVPRAFGTEAARRRVLEELGPRLEELAGPAVAAAVLGRSSLGRFSYGEALGHFRAALAAEEALFFRYPSLLGDAGRAFVYAAAHNEGMELFRDWNRRIGEGSFDGKGLDLPEIRYYIFYYMGRMQRALLRYAEAAEYFAQALDFAPDPVQADACVWYILSMSLQNQPGGTVSLISRYISRWNNDGYFADILDRLARHLVSGRRWNSMAEVFSLIEGRSDQGGAQESIAQYAYILGSALSAGLFSPDPGSKRSAEDYFRIALGQGGASFYYPHLAAFRLGENTAPLAGTEGAVPDKRAGNSRDGGDDLEFLLGFFKYGAANLAFDFVSADADRLGPDELRALASAFAEAGFWEASIRTVGSYAGREGYRMNRRDMELYYPLAFADLVETAAEEEGLGRELFFGLLRTESAFSPGIRSRAGATGLAQLMGATASDMAIRVRRGGGPDYAADGEIDLEDPAVNIRLGAAYLRYLMDRSESPLLALLAYNGGIGRLRRWRNAESALDGDLFLETLEYDETRGYARKVLAAAAAYGYLYYGMTMEAIFADMYR